MGYNVLQDAFVSRVQGNPGSIAPGRRLVEYRERVGVGVEKVGHDEGSEVPREYSEVDHDPLQVVVEVSTKQWADRGEGDGEWTGPGEIRVPEVDTDEDEDFLGLAAPSQRYADD